MDEVTKRRQERARALGETFSKMLFVINGGALVAVLALLAQLYASPDTVHLAKSMVWPAGLFLTGLLGAVFAVFWEMLSLFPLMDGRLGTNEHGRNLYNFHAFLRRVSGICIATSIVTFMAGAIASFAVLA